MQERFDKFDGFLRNAMEILNKSVKRYFIAIKLKELNLEMIMI